MNEVYSCSYYLLCNFFKGFVNEQQWIDAILAMSCMLAEQPGLVAMLCSVYVTLC